MHSNREQTVVRDLASLYDRNPIFPTAKVLLLVVVQKVISLDLEASQE
jgi:hypothetical protein